MSRYGFGKKVEMGFDAAIARVTEALQKEGFGILTEIDVAATLKKKLNADIPAYRILGACNPPLAHKAIEMEPDIGLLLPCNVLVREQDDGRINVGFMDPIAVLGLVQRKDMEALGADVRGRLERVRDAVGK